MYMLAAFIAGPSLPAALVPVPAAGPTDTRSAYRWPNTVNYYLQELDYQKQADLISQLRRYYFLLLTTTNE
eukprot:scaffold36408_cov53-Attheya_sp.AAC.6